MPEQPAFIGNYQERHRDEGGDNHRRECETHRFSRLCDATRLSRKDQSSAVCALM
jgi:hypothetical protein